MIELLHNFHFLRPYAFFALLPLGYFIFKNYRKHADSIGHWQKICDRELLAYLLDKSDSQSTRIQFWLTSFMAFLAIVALAAPAWQKLPTPAFRNNSALVIALNLSYSMNAEDIKPSRLIRARYKIDDLLEQRKDGQTALLVYSNAAFTVTPLTNDIQTIRSQLEALTTDIMPAQGNSTLAGLEKAASLLKQAGLLQGHILLITDDVSLSNNSEIAKNTLGSYQLSILGVGTTEGSPVPLPEGGFLKDELGQIIVPKLNSAELLKVAVANHGYFQTMTADDTDIQKLLNRFDESLNRPADKTNLFLEQWDDAGYWLIFLIVPWAAFQFRKGMLCLAILIVLPFPKNSYAFEWQNLWRTPDQQAQRAYNKQHYEQAAEKFENPDWKAAAQYQSGDFENATANFQQTGNFYNQGNALAKKGQFTEALAAYEQALKENPYDNDAKHNKELVEKELKKQQKNNKQDKPSDSKDNSNQDSQKSKESNNDSKSPDSQSEQKKEHQAGNNPEKKEDAKKEESKNNEKSNESKNSNEKQTEQQNKNQATESESLTTEQQQANEQWLKRIPDDPATLLKRKFKYQYNQQY